MLFNSYIFIFLFLPLTLSGWNILNKLSKYKTALAFLTVMSLWFYSYFNKYYLIIIVASIAGNYALSAFLDIKEKSDRVTKGNRIFILLSGIALNLGILFYYKYYDFFIENINMVFKTDYNLRHILLPLGISFFTFQQLSYMLDRYMGKASHYSLLEYAAFVSFFPQLIAGPIVLHSELIPQFKDVSKRYWDGDKFYDGIVIFVIGLSKKVLLADTLARIANYGFENAIFLDSFSSMAMLVAYSLELYFDFSGYSDMAIGLGLMFGIELPVNFNSPYKASSLKALWGRWHMTLTRFMTTYVYIPLGGSRKGKLRTLVNVFIVFLVSGFWHGAAWTYIAWGALTGLIVVWDNLDIIGFERDGKKTAKLILPRHLGIIFTNIAFTMLLIPFRSNSLFTAKQIFLNLFKGWTGNIWKLSAATMDIPEVYLIKQIMLRAIPDNMAQGYLVLMLILIAIGIFAVTRKNAGELLAVFRGKKVFNVMLAILFVYSIISFSQVSTFIYFNF